MNIPEGIRSTIQTVVENAYLRAALHEVKKGPIDLSAEERATMLSSFEHAIQCDVELLRASYVQFAAHTASEQVSERLNDVELSPVVFDTEQGGDDAADLEE